jgi:hypothetical protein
MPVQRQLLFDRAMVSKRSAKLFDMRSVIRVSTAPRHLSEIFFDEMVRIIGEPWILSPASFNTLIELP